MDKSNLILAKTSKNKPVRQYIYQTDDNGHPIGGGFVIAEGKINSIGNIEKIIPAVKKIHSGFQTEPFTPENEYYQDVMKKLK